MGYKENLIKKLNDELKYNIDQRNRHKKLWQELELEIEELQEVINELKNEVV